MNRKAYGLLPQNVLEEFGRVVHTTQRANGFIIDLAEKWRFQTIKNTPLPIPKETWDMVMATIKADYPDVVTIDWDKSEACKYFQDYYYRNR